MIQIYRKFVQSISISYLQDRPHDIPRGADKSLARRTSRCILFDCENILFDASLFIYINNINIPPTMIVNMINEHQNISFVVACFLPCRAKDISTPLYNRQQADV